MAGKIDVAAFTRSTNCAFFQGTTGCKQNKKHINLLLERA